MEPTSAVTSNKHIRSASPRAESLPNATVPQNPVLNDKNNDDISLDLGMDDRTIKHMLEYFKLDNGSVDDLIRYIRELARHNRNNL